MSALGPLATSFLDRCSPCPWSPHLSGLLLAGASRETLSSCRALLLPALSEPSLTAMLLPPRPYGNFPLPLGQSGCIPRVQTTPDIDKSEQKNRTVPLFSGQSVRVSCGGVIVSFQRAKQDPVLRLGGGLPARLPAPQIQLAFPALIPPVSPTCPGRICWSEDE